MHSMQRQVARVRGKGGADTAKVSVLLNDFEDADKLLTKVCTYKAARLAIREIY
jgi:amphiphysin